MKQPTRVTYYPDFEKHNPLRELDWRWRRARELLAKNRYFSPKRDDLLTGRALRYLRARDRCLSDKSISRLAREFPDIVEACAIKRNRPLALEIEARLLAGQTPSEIAELTDATTLGVTAYEELFYSVLDRLDCEDYIATYVIPRNDLFSMFDGGFGISLRRFAYLGGPEILDVMLGLAQHGCEDGSVEHDLSTAAGRLLCRADLAVTIDNLSIDGDDAWGLLRVVYDLLGMLESCAPKPRIRGVFGALVGPMTRERLEDAAETFLQRRRARESQNERRRRPTAAA